MVPLYRTTLHYSQQETDRASSSFSVWSHWGPRWQYVQTTTTWPFFITWNSILSLLPVNKYIILNGNPPPIVHTTFCALSNPTHQHAITSYKVKLSLCFISTTQLGSLDRDKWFVSWPCHLALSMDRVGGWDSLRCSLHALMMRENFSPARNWHMFPYLSSPQHCLLAKQAIAQLVKKLSILHTERIFVLGLQAPRAATIPSATLQIM